MAHYLVTGGCGFIGSHLCDELIAAGHRVRVVDNLSSGQREYLSPKAELIVGDIRDAALMARAVQGIDGCFHLAAIASVQQSQAHWYNTHSINLGGAITVFEALRDARIPVVYASSAAVYGDNDVMPLSEESKATPLTPYGADKLGCELHAHAGFHSYKMPSVGLRFFNVYGSRQRPDSPYSGVISIFIGKHLAHQPITIFGDGGQMRDFIHVQDVVASTMAVMQKMTPDTCRVLNVCTGEPTTVNQLADVIAGAMGHDVPRVHAATRAGDIRASLGDPARLKHYLGEVPMLSLAQGIALTLGG